MLGVVNMQRLTALRFVSIIGIAVGIVGSTLTSCVSPSPGKKPEKFVTLVLQVQTTPQVKQISHRDLQAVKQVIEKRLQGLKISDSLIQVEGKNQIIVRVPQTQNPATQNLGLIQRVITTSTKLEFKQQKPKTQAEFQALLNLETVLRAEQEILRTTANKTAILKNKQELEKNQNAIAQLFTSSNPPLTGGYVQDAYPQSTPGNGWEIGLTFDRPGSELFAKVTKEVAGKGRSIGIFLDQELISAPVVDSVYTKKGITGGKAVIAGNFNQQQANELSLQLRSGALPLPVKLTSVR